MPGLVHPNPKLRILQGGTVIIDTSVSELHARSIALLAWQGGIHCSAYPGDWPVVMGRIALTIEAALQDDIAAHTAWLRLCETCESLLQVELHGSGSFTPEADGSFSGGAGGDACWFGGGGGGGGDGIRIGGPGGDGAAGGLVIFMFAEDGALIDVDVYVMPGSSQWIMPAGVHRLKLFAMGGGGGGAGGRRWE